MWRTSFLRSVWVLRIVCTLGDPHLKPDFSRVQGERDQVGHAASRSSWKHLDDSWRRDICIFSTGHVQLKGLQGRSTKTLSPWTNKGSNPCKEIEIFEHHTCGQNWSKPRPAPNIPIKCAIALESAALFSKKEGKTCKTCRLEFLNSVTATLKTPDSPA